MRVLLFALLLVVNHAARADVTIDKAWARATPPNSKVGVIYTEMRATTADAIVALTSPAAERVEVHTTVMEDGTMKMRHATNVTLPANETVRFASGGLHIMLVGLRGPLIAGAHFELTIRFHASGQRTIRVPVLAPDASPPTN